jgi:hypothetical protein
MYVNCVCIYLEVNLECMYIVLLLFALNKLIQFKLVEKYIIYIAMLMWCNILENFKNAVWNVYN